jgi:hypothetical protein
LKFKNESSECPQAQSQQDSPLSQNFDIAYNKNPSCVTDLKPINEVIQDVVFTAENTANVLRGASDWGEIKLSQEEINEAWGLLAESEQAKLHELYAEFQQRNHSPEIAQKLQSAIREKTAVREVGFGSQHFRQYQVIRILENGFAWVRKMWGDKGECEMSIFQLSI